MKQCTLCKINKHLEFFSFSDKNKGYRKSRCKECISKLEKETMPWKKRNRYRGGVRNNEKRFSSKREEHLWYAYKLTSSDYDNLVDSQNGRCAICSKKSKLVVDHCHDSGNVRGLLCHNCNIGLGLLGDTAEYLKKAYEYLS